MRITDLLKKDTIILNLQASTKQEVLDELIGKLNEAGKLVDADQYKEAILAREAQSTTGIGEGIAIPHAKTAAVKTPAIAFGRSEQGIDFEAFDGKPSHLFFMIAASEGANNAHLETLSRLSTLLMDDAFRAKLEAATSADEIVRIIDEKESENGEVAEERTEQKGKIIAVTACPTGIAHTFMAAEALKKKAAELGLEIKVETNGASGIENKLTAGDISDALGVIVAADKHVETARFAGKKVLQVPVAEAMKRPEELLTKIAEGNAPVFGGEAEASNDGGKEVRKQSAFYKHLMNGVSNMLPFVIGGGILIAICFLFGIKAFDPKDPSYHPIAEALMTIGGGNAFALMVPVLAGFIGMSIADRPGFAAGMVGGMLAASGGAGFIGGIIAGFLGGYIVVALRKLLAGLPKWLEGIKSILLYPVLGIGITGFVMMFVVNKPVKALNDGITDVLQGMGTSNAILLGIVLGLMMSFDMGGPLNKAAYVFATGLLASNVTEPMAAVMAAGMTPPIGIAIATMLFKKKFTAQEQESRWSTLAMGISFITEGAIPFAAADPLRVIPSLMAGSAVAGGLSMSFKIGLAAPHGGIFVLPLGAITGGAILYIVAILAGSLVSAVLLGLLKKDVK